MRSYVEIGNNRVAESVAVSREYGETCTSVVCTAWYWLQIASSGQRTLELQDGKGEEGSQQVNDNSTETLCAKKLTN